MFGRKKNKDKKLGKKKRVAVISKQKEHYPDLVSVSIKNHKDKKGGHPHVIVDNIDKRHVSIGLTTKAKKGKNATNYKLEVSPLDDGKQSYMRRQGIVASYKEYEKLRRGKMTPKDYLKATDYGEKAKQKFLNEKNKKK